MLGAFHGMEIGYAFGNLDPDASAEDKALSKAMTRYWVRFATTGDPNVEGLPEWPAYDPKTDLHLELGDEIKAGAHYRKEAVDVLDAIWNGADVTGRLDALRAPDVDTWVAIPNAVGITLERLAQRDALDALRAPDVDTWVAFPNAVGITLERLAQRDALDALRAPDVDTWVPIPNAVGITLERLAQRDALATRTSPP